MEDQARFRLNVLGRVALARSDGSSVTEVLSQPRRLAVLVYLAMQGNSDGVLRDEIAAVFWPDRSDAKARQALRQTLYVLRKALGPDALVSSADRIKLPRQLWSCDASELTDASKSGDTGVVAELYQGDFLPGFHVSRARQWEGWRQAMEDSLRALGLDAFWQLAQTAVAANEWSAVRQWAGRVLDVMPRSQNAAALMIRALTHLDRQAEAVQFAATFSEKNGPTTQGTNGSQLRDALATLAASETQDDVAVAHPQVARHPATTPPPDLASDPTSLSSARKRSVRSRVGVALGVGVITAGALWASPFSSDAPLRAQGPPTVAVEFVANETGDPRYTLSAEIATDWTVRRITQTELVRVVLVTTATRGTARPNPDYLLRATIRPGVGSGLLVGELLDFETRAVLGRGDPIELSPTRPPAAALESYGNSLVGLLATHIDRVFSTSHQDTAPPLLRFPNDNAYQEYLVGVEEWVAGRSFAAAERLTEAFNGDTTFLSALVLAGAAQWDFGRHPAAIETARYVRERRGRLGTFDGALADLVWARLNNDVAAALVSADRLSELLPGSVWTIERARIALNLNRSGEVLEILSQVDSNQPLVGRSDVFWYIKALAHLSLDEYDEAFHTYEMAIQQSPESVRIRPLGPAALAASGDLFRLDSLMSALDRQSSTSPAVFEATATSLIWSGHEVNGQTLATVGLRRANAGTRSSAPSHPAGLNTLNDRMAEARLLALAGRPLDALLLLDQVLQNDSVSSFWKIAVHGDRGTIAALASDSDAAQESLNFLDGVQRDPATWGDDRIRAAGILMSLGRKEEALRALADARREGITPAIYWRSFILLPFKDVPEALRILAPEE